MSNTRIVRQIIEAAGEAARGPGRFDVSGGDRPGSGYPMPQDLSRNVAGKAQHSFVLGFDRFSDADAVFE